MMSNVIGIIFKILLIVTLATCRRQDSPVRSQDYISYIPSQLDYSPHQIPLQLWYDSGVPNLYWPVVTPTSSNVPTVNVPVLNVPVATVPNIGVPLGNVPPSLYPYPYVPGVTYGHTPNVGYIPNGIVPPLQPRPVYPPNVPPRRPTTEFEDDESDRREPLQPNSDGVVDPEVGLRENLKLGPTMFGGTFDFDNMRFNGFSSWLKLLSSTTTPWWRGPNVCVEREEKITTDDEEDEEKNKTDISEFFKSSINIQTCFEYGNTYECTNKEQKLGITKVMTVTYTCCHGSQLHNRVKCVESQLYPLVETITDLNGTQFLTIAQSASEMLSTQNVTVFLPSNEVFQKFSDMMLLTNQVEINVDPSRRRRAVAGFSPSDLAMNHIVKGFHGISPDEVYLSMFNNSSLQIKFTRDSKMVNCARIGKSVHATNGIVHTIDRVLMPVTRNISEILHDRPEFSIIKNLLEKTGLMNYLAEDEIWTLFAPTNSAFEKLDSEVLKKITNNGCAKNILKYHMLSQPLCSSEVTKKMKIKNCMGEMLKLSLPKQNGEDEEINTLDAFEPAFLIENINVVKPDILATNGIIHAIDEIIIPETASPITVVLQQKNLSRFYSLIKKSGMLEEIQNYSNVTFFVPTDKAFNQYFETKRDINFLKKHLEYDEETNGLMSKPDKDILRTFILHHMVQGAVQSCGLEDNGFLNTIQNDAKLRMNLYSTFLTPNIYNRATIDCARLLHFDYQQCGNILHQIDRPLFPHIGNIRDEINYMESLSMLNKVLPGTDTENILMDNQDITFLAPTNEAFESINKADYEELLTNKEMVDTILKQHIIKGVSCCSGLNYIPWPFTSYLKAFNDVQLEVHNERIGNAPIKSCDHIASNGVMHFTNKVMIPRKIQQNNLRSNFEIMLFGDDIQ